MILHNKYFLINGMMFIIIFGSIILCIKVEKKFLHINHTYMIQESIRNRTFVKIERIQNKSFFGYNHYYFTLSFWYKGKSQSIIKKVSPTIYYKYKEGSELEAILIIDLWGYPKIFLIPQIFEESSLEEVKHKNIETISHMFFSIGILFMIAYGICKFIEKKQKYA